MRGIRWWMGMGVWTVLALVPVAALAAKAPTVTARSAAVMDGRTGEILWSKNPDQQLSPASTTKVMTAIVALESGRLRESIVASPGAATVQPRKVYLRAGQRAALEDLLYAILLNSANDASAVIAEGLAGSVAAFGQRMTARARELGAAGTRFVNPHGLTAEGHYSTARDQATIFRHALGLAKFREIMNTKAKVIRVDNPVRQISLRSHNRLLDQYEVPVIGKTGYTRAAKKCFVGAGKRNGREIIVALLGSTDMWGDARRLLNFGFADPPTARPARQQARVAGEGTGATAAAAPAAVAMPEPAVAHDAYAVRVGSAFDRLERARRLKRALGNRGFAAEIGRVASGQGKNRQLRYHVEVGPFTNRGAAESVLRQVAAQVALPAHIVRR